MLAPRSRGRRRLDRMLEVLGPSQALRRQDQRSKRLSPPELPPASPFPSHWLRPSFPPTSFRANSKEPSLAASRQPCPWLPLNQITRLLWLRNHPTLSDTVSSPCGVHAVGGRLPRGSQGGRSYLIATKLATISADDRVALTVSY